MTRPTLLLLLALLGSGGHLKAQILSPGKLTSVHAELEGVRSCTSCHELRKKGISPDLCLDCHEALAARLEAGSGYHASLQERDCAACHKEHFGRDFALVRFDTSTFAHEETGYRLDGAHVDAGCRDCHRADWISDPLVRGFKSEHGALQRTFLGLPTECASCHEPDDPHRGQFEGRACTGCHDTRGWEGAGEFDHATARFVLEGAHRDVECASCHGVAGGAAPGEARYRPLSFSSCTSCHEDEHRGAMSGSCTTCHSTAGWLPVRRDRVEGRFDHTTTGFLLEGRHATAPCASCHDASIVDAPEGVVIRFVAGTEARAFPTPDADSCRSCHVDTHQGAFADRADGGACRACHGQDAWLPAGYDLGRHDAESAFALRGAHRATPCASCHRVSAGDFVVRPAADSCRTCHAASDPHGEQFAGRGCDSCHGEDSFRVAAFDHERTRFSLDGAHVDLDCAACHRTSPAGMIIYRPLGTTCRDCHGGAPRPAPRGDGGGP